MKSLTKVRLNQIKAFIKEEDKMEDIKPKDIAEKIKCKFGVELDYQLTANCLYKSKIENFEKPTSDANNLVFLCQQISQDNDDFFFAHCLSEQSEQMLKAIFVSTPSMNSCFQHYKNLLILDTTFATNRFKMPLFIGIVVNSEGRSALVFFSLLSDEKESSFDWAFDRFRVFKDQAPENILSNECIALTNSVKKAFPNSNHYICSLHKSLNIKRSLGRHGCFGTLKSKFGNIYFSDNNYRN